MFKKIRFFWRLLTTFAIRRKKIIFLSFFLGAVSFLLLPRIFILIEQRQETMSIGFVGRYSTNDIPEEIQNKISFGLTQLKDDGTASVGLAQEWIVEDGGRSYTFTLGENYWHDGTKIMAEDVNYNFRDVTSTILDDRTILFKLNEPFSPFPSIVSRPLFKKGLVGAGLYKVLKITRNGQFLDSLFLKSLDWQKPNILYRFYPTEGSAKTALKLGEISILKNILDPSGFEGWENMEVKSQTKLDYFTAVFFDTSKPTLAEKNYRQALSYAIPKEKSDRALGPISPKSWAYNDDVKPYSLDMENAKKLLGKDEKSQDTIRLTAGSSFMDQADKIKKAWEELGIKTEIVPMGTSLGDFEALLAVQEIPADPDQYSLWHSSQEDSNITNFNNPRVDQLLEEGRKTQDVTKRKQIYFDFQRFLVEEVPAVFLYHPLTYEISRK